MPNPSVALIYARSSNYVIGRDNALPWNIKEDLQMFKELTVGKPIIMGRKTYESIGIALPLRTNLVITSNKEFKPNNVIVVRTLGEALEKAKTICNPKEIMIIGGGEVYKQALPIADVLYETIVHLDVDGDTYVPEEVSTWPVTSFIHNEATETTPAFTFCTRIKPD